MPKRKNSVHKKPRGKMRMLTLPQELDDWLIEHTKKRGASSIQETVRQILTAARATEQEQQAA
jgi:hypothetical protein